MKLTELEDFDSRTSCILTESWQDFNRVQRKYLHLWELGIWPLVEQHVKLLEHKLTDDEIKKIFLVAEQLASTSSDNKTMLGKAGQVGSKFADLSDKFSDRIKQLVNKAGNLGSVKNADKKFKDLADRIKNQTTNQDIHTAVDDVINYVEKNPNKKLVGIAVLTVVLEFETSKGDVPGTWILSHVRKAL